jgi:hypothetical protein
MLYCICLHKMHVIDWSAGMRRVWLFWYNNRRVWLWSDEAGVTLHNDKCVLQSDCWLEELGLGMVFGSLYLQDNLATACSLPPKHWLKTCVRGARARLHVDRAAIVDSMTRSGQSRQSTCRVTATALHRRIPATVIIITYGPCSAGCFFFLLISRLWLFCCERKTLFHGW